MRRRILVLILLATGVGLSLDMVEQFTRQADYMQTNISEVREPDYYGETIEFRQYQADGSLEQTLTASSSEHFPLDGHTLLINPVIKSPGSETQWQIRADTSQVSDQKNQTRLSGNVILRYSDTQTSDTTITTDFLDYTPDLSLASTDTPVLINTKQGTTSAVGMKLEIDRQRMELLSQVSTRYANQ